MITIDFNIEFSVAHVEVQGYEGEIDEDGTVEIEVPCCCGGFTSICLSADDLQELSAEAKKFRDRRVAFRARREPR